MGTHFSINGLHLTIGNIRIPPEFCVLCFSHSQQAFHRESLVEHIKINLKNLRDKKPGDYVVVGIFPNEGATDSWYKMLTRWVDRPELGDISYDDLLPPDPE